MIHAYLKVCADMSFAVNPKPWDWKLEALYENQKALQRRREPL